MPKAHSRPDELAQLHEELNRTAFHLLAVNQAMKMLGSVLQLQRTLDLTIDMFVEITRALYGYVVLRERGTAFAVRAAKGEKAEPLIGKRIAVSQSAVRWLKAQRTPAVVSEEAGDIPQSMRALLSHGPDPSALFIPLVTTNRLVGFVSLGEKFGGASYSPEELEVLATLGAQTAIAIENARLVQRLKGKVRLANRELREANRALSIEMAKLRATVEAMADGLFVTDARGRITFANPAVCDFLGWVGTSVEGKKVRESTSHEELVKMVETVTNGTEAHAEREIVVTEPLRRVYSARATALRDHKDRLQGAVTVLSDVTALKELSDMKADFVAFVSHELRTPLTSIQGCVGTLSMYPPDTFDEETVNELYGIISDECDRLVRMVNELLDVSKLEAGRPLALNYTQVDLRELIANVVQIQERHASDRHNFVIDIPDNLPTVEADKDRVVQIVTNLLSNAVKYSPEGGTVTTRVTEQSDAVTVSVSDEGIGMKPEDIPRLFQRYHRIITEDTLRIRGTGLGLYLVHELVKLHGGRIWVESEYGKGSTFYFTIPRQRPDNQSEE